MKGDVGRECGREDGGNRCVCVRAEGGLTGIWETPGRHHTVQHALLKPKSIPPLESQRGGVGPIMLQFTLHLTSLEM